MERLCVTCESLPVHRNFPAAVTRPPGGANAHLPGHLTTPRGGGQRRLGRHALIGAVQPARLGSLIPLGGSLLLVAWAIEFWSFFGFESFE